MIIKGDRFLIWFDSILKWDWNRIDSQNWESGPERGILRSGTGQILKIVESGVPDKNIESRAAWPHFNLMFLYCIYFCSHTLSKSMPPVPSPSLSSMQTHFLSPFHHRVLHFKETTKTPPILSEVALEPHGSSCLWCLPSPISSVLPPPAPCNSTGAQISSNFILVDLLDSTPATPSPSRRPSYSRPWRMLRGKGHESQVGKVSMRDYCSLKNFKKIKIKKKKSWFYIV